MDIWIPSANERIPYTNEHTSFVPRGWVDVDGLWRPLVFKVVTQDLQSLGLRHNPTIMTFPVGQWVYEGNELVAGKEDHGGIWSALLPSGAKTITKYMARMYGVEARTFLATVDNPLYANQSYRVKSEAVYLIKEITGWRKFPDDIVWK